MTMQHLNHPEDERLAALAASEPDALTDSSLVAHVSGCARCAPMVQDLRTLHSALAELPDIRPSRPLRFLPAVPELASHGSRWLGGLRAITAPAMAIAVLLIVVGTFGVAFSNGIGFMGSAGAAPDLNRTLSGAQSSVGGAAPVPLQAGKSAAPGASAAVPGSVNFESHGSPGAFATPSLVPSTNDAAAADRSLSAFSRGATEVDTGRPPYALMLGAGVVLLAAAFVARGYVRRRSIA
jgi:hypothetical protein